MLGYCNPFIQQLVEPVKLARHLPIHNTCMYEEYKFILLSTFVKCRNPTHINC